MQTGNAEKAANAATREPVSTDTGGRAMRADLGERRCALTRAVLPRSDLVRFVLGPDDAVVADLAEKLPGRGVWITCSQEAVTAAVKRNAFARSFKAKVAASEDLADQVEALMVRRLRDALSIANKAGLVASGFSKVERTLHSGKVRALFHATDGSEDGSRKLDRLFAAIALEMEKTALTLKILSSDELSLALGRSNVVHAALSLSLIHI